jgi:hypothetical protein
MLNDAWFLKVVRAQIEADKRLFRPATLTTDHALRLLEMAERAGPRRQAAPVPGEGDVWAELIADGERRGSIPPRVLDLMRERRQVGIDRYGVPLQRGNRRDGLRDLLEELLDAVAYSALCGRQFGILVDLISMFDADMRAKG